MELIHEELTEQIIGCAIAVHDKLGPCLPEHAYQTAIALEMKAQGLTFLREPELVVKYRDVVVGLHKPDFIVEGKVVLELKCVQRLEEVFRIQVLRYLHLTKLRVGLIINFNVAFLKKWRYKARRSLTNKINNLRALQKLHASVSRGL
jgi:GxxExxY protein